MPKNLITTYLEDVEKFSKNSNQTKIIRHIINNSIKLAGERIKFEGFAQSNYKSRDISECFHILQILDTGIINKFAGVQLQILSNNKIDNIFEGKIAEHITGQELSALQTSASAKNTFWVKEKKQSNAEVDFILQINNLIIPIEVKLGKTGRLRSLMEFIDLAPHNYAVRVYSGKFSIEKTKTIKNKTFFLLNLPFYLISQIEKHINFMIESY